MQTDYLHQMPRNSLIWLLVAMFAGIAPHFERIPLWLTLICLLCGWWRVRVYQSRWYLPGFWLKGFLVVAGIFTVFMHYGTLLGPEAGSSLLILAFCFKLLESSQRRDAFIVVVLGYFVVATAFFFSQSMLGAIYLLGVCFLITAALLGLNQSPSQTQPSVTARYAGKLLLQSLPVMIVLFVFVPRVEPFWDLNVNKGGAKTGLSDEVSPGDIANLSRSPALAFRAEFTGQPPANQQLYWRALVLDHYDGQRWTRGGRGRDSEPRVNFGSRSDSGFAQWPKVEYLGQRYRYRIIMEPTDQNWLFALPAVRSEGANIGYSDDHRLVSRQPIKQPFGYWLESDLNYRLDPNISQYQRDVNLQLPSHGDAETRALAMRWRQQSTTDEAYIQRVLQHFREQPYRYTLRPKTLSGDRIDQFMFTTREGFCSHYASAFVYMMRAAGLPARMVSGYQGGEYNALGGYYLVHQFDAHAWAEVWLPGQGWRRYDPTAAIAPERIEFGLEEALAQEQSFLEGSLFSPVRYRNVGWVSQLRLSWDYVNYIWQRSIVGYNARTQVEFLSRFLGQVSWVSLGLYLVLGVGSILLLISAYLLWRNRSLVRDPALKAYFQLCRTMARQGLPRQTSEPPAQYLQRLAQAQPDKAHLFTAFAKLFVYHCYADAVEADRDKQRIAQLRRLARQV